MGRWIPIEIPRTELTVHQEKAILVSVDLPTRPLSLGDRLEEIRGLTEAAGARVVGEMTQRRQYPKPATYLGKGKVQELTDLAKAADADVIIFDNDLSPSQTRNLEKATSIKVLDRSELIMDIFATRARTVAARLQVELAQLEYSLPRLKNMWTHLSRYKGGIGLRGPGETQLEEDRRLVDLRIRDLKQRLREVQARKEREVASRQEEYTVSLVGYTNAGKSTLMNALTDAEVLTKDQLFSTLDTRTRVWEVKNWGKILLSDTVGFIRDLPHHLVASFKATLEEARQARLLLHVIDASNAAMSDQINSVRSVLRELDCDQKPNLFVLNKIDRIEDVPSVEAQARTHFSEGTRGIVSVSAQKKLGLDALTQAVINALTEDTLLLTVTFDAGNGKLLAYIAAHAEVLSQRYENDHVIVDCLFPRSLLHMLEGPGIRVQPKT